MRRWPVPTRGVRACLALVLGVLAGSAVGADEPPPAAPVAAAVTPEEQADAVLAAVAAKDEAALKGLAAKDDPDPWLVVDALLARGEHDAAEAFAKAAPRVDVEALPAYVQAARGRAPAAAEHERLAAANGTFKAEKFEQVLEITAEPLDVLDTIVRVRLQTSRGRALAKLSRWTEGASVQRHGAAAAAALGWLRRASELHDGAARAAAEGADRVGALESRAALLAILERRGEERGAAWTLGQIGIDRAEMQDHAGALAAYAQSLARFQALKDEEQIARTFWNIAITHQEQGEFAKEVAALEGALRAEEARGNEPGALEKLLQLGGACGRLGEHAKALSILERGLARSEALGDKAVTCTALARIGDQHHALQDAPNARRFYERSLALADEFGQHDASRNALASLGRMHLDLGEHPQAFAVFQDLLDRRKALGDEADAAYWLFRIATVHSSRGDHAKAVTILEKALREQERLGLKPAAALTHSHIGISYLALGEFAKALAAQERALAGAQAKGNKAQQAAEIINLGNIYCGLGDYATALSFCERGLALATEIGHREWRAAALTNISAIYIDSWQPEKALRASELALVEQEALRDRDGAAKSLSNIGVVHVYIGDFEKGLAALERALEIEEALGNHAGVAKKLGLIGDALLRSGDEARGHEFLERAARMARSRRLAPVLKSMLVNSARARLKAGDSARALRDALEALDLAEGLLGNLDDEQGSLARAAYSNLFAIGALAALRQEDPDELLKFLDSGRAGALLDSLDQREALRWKAEFLPPELQRLEGEARAKERAARDAFDVVSRGADRAAALAAAKTLDEAIDALRAVVNRIQRELKQAALFYPRVRTIEDVRSVLKPGQALVIYGLCLGEGLALVLWHDGERMVTLGNVDELIAACEALEAKDAHADVQPALETLRQRLVEPLALDDGVTQVIVSPEGPLCYLPFAALFRQPVAMTPSGTTHVLLLEEQRKRGQGILALGDPDYAGVSDGAKAIYYRGRTLAPLPATRAEATTIGSVTLLGAEASEAGFHAAVARSSGWRAVHFACHGLVNVVKPMLSSLALSRAGDGDGFLTASEVLRTQIPADLAVLSACETATGSIVRGEGIVGLVRAFMFAGAPRVICSLWKVDDEATSALMTKFYELWNPALSERSESKGPPDGSKGLPTAEALRQAQEFVRSQERWKHPFYWAAWVLWGLPD